MKLIDLLEKDKDRLLTELAGAVSPDKASVVLQNEVDKLLLRYNDQCTSEKERDAAAYMLQAARLAAPLVDSAGETKIWEREGASKEPARKVSIPAIILIIAGIALCGVGLVPLLTLIPETAPANTSLIRLAYLIGGIVAVLVGGILAGRPTGKKSKNQFVEIHIDPNKVYRNFRTIILSIDQSLEEVRAAERWSKREQAGNIDGRQATTPEIELFADLLAASYSGDPEFALEKIDEIKYYLHKQQIEVVDFSEKTRQYFDLMPGIQAGTIRPALVADGALLKKGLASTGK